MKRFYFSVFMACFSCNVYCFSSVNTVGFEVGVTNTPIDQTVSPTFRQFQIRKKSNHMGVFMDTNMYKNFGFIAGYEGSFGKSMDTIAYNADETSINSLKLNKKGPYFLLSMCAKIADRISVFIGMGVKRTTINLKFSAVADNVVHGVYMNQVVFTNNKKVVPKVCLGVKYGVKKNLWLRLACSWEKLSKFKDLNGKDVFFENQYKMKLKDSITYAVGLAYKPF
jgi:hypothetical protein